MPHDHDRCKEHGHCLVYPNSIGCPHWKSMYCPYHSRTHSDITKKSTHKGCKQHGHCLYPSSCPYSRACTS